MVLDYSQSVDPVKRCAPIVLTRHVASECLWLRCTSIQIRIAPVPLIRYGTYGCRRRDAGRGATEVLSDRLTSCSPAASPKLTWLHMCFTTDLLSRRLLYDIEANLPDIMLALCRNPGVEKQQKSFATLADELIGLMAGTGRLASR